ncbi:D-alanyl-lipoteichoic acid biosynthesis protein DltD [Staphylococcus massiliensis]|uniref:D-alanyl-lipoteichoic acid biosynthesis protein DltD n=1 Tax=Staphylococcus massiliensis TaxID=555791 RepID=UPI001EDF5749|nr:D-alanyl-lipoteichoic acid biosynthesis protein DltD [Staphylococcus massiliensis]MCG3401661.1 D-alanyl-lipoteichoic acid biosynthesis protein DltD [Staphylococcus massiliensis]
MNFKLFLPIIISGCVFIIFLLLPSSLFEKPLKATDIKERRLSLDDEVLKGTSIQNCMWASDAYYPIFGSSELEKDDPFSPGIVLDQRQTGYTPFLVGAGGSTDLIQMMSIGAQYDQLKGKKLAIIISPQWFTRKGLTNVNFDARHSKLQMNQLFQQDKMPLELKIRFAKQVSRFKAMKDNDYLQSLIETKTLPEEPFLSSFEAHNLNKIDAIKSNFTIHNQKAPVMKVEPVTTKDMPYKEMQQLAEDYGQKQTSSNAFKIRDEYWDLIKANKRKINRNHEFRTKSKEYDDLALLVDTLHEAEADALFIVILTNGKWYDHIGIKKERRDKVYDKITSTIKKHHGKVYDMTDKDYEPYVVSDAVHIGYKGYVYINERIEQHMKEK